MLHGRERRENSNGTTRGPLVRSVKVTTPEIKSHDNGDANIPGRKYLLPIEKITDDKLEEDPSITTSETSDEELKRPIYVTSPETGRRVMTIQFHVQGFVSQDIRVRISDRNLVVFASHRENDSGRKSTTEFCRRIKLPEDADLDKLKCSFQNELLTIEAQTLETTQELEKTSKPTLEQDQPLNTPFLTQSEFGSLLNVQAEVGSLFRADDVVVKLKGSKRLVVLAERQESDADGKTTLSAKLRREFELPAAINPVSLKAGLTHKGILNVSAVVQDDILV